MQGIQNVLLVAYLLIVLALIAVILLQRSEGGGLGIGGNTGGLMTVRGSANLLTRTTAVLAALFFGTAIALTILSSLDHGTSDILKNAALAPSSGPAATTGASSSAAGGTVLDQLTQMQNANAPADASTGAGGTGIPTNMLQLQTPADTTSADANAVAASDAATAPAADASTAPAPVASAAPASSAPPDTSSGLSSASAQ